MVDIQAGSSPDHVYYDALEDPSDPPPAPSEPPLHLTWPDLANHPASCKPALIALEAAQDANIPYGYQHAAWSLGLGYVHRYGYVQGLSQYCRRAVIMITLLGKEHALGDWPSTAAKPCSAPGMQVKLSAMRLAETPLRPGRWARQLCCIATHTMQVPLSAAILQGNLTLDSPIVSPTSQVLDSSSSWSSICKHSTSEAASGPHLE